MPRRPVHRRRTPLKRVVLSLLVMLAVGVIGAGGVALWGMRAIEAPGPLSETTNVVIEHGQPTTEIGAVLERSGVVSDHRLFIVTTYLTRSQGGSLKAGEYEFPARASLAQVLSILRSGRSVVHSVTVPEGWTSRQVVERVNAHPALIGTIEEVPPEGSLLPDTYVFQRGVEREVLLARMRDAQARLLDDLWEARDPDLPIETPQEALILASIVEKETGVPEERPQVAAVFINRLRQNMRLQSDPTIIYGIVGGGRLDRPIRRSDISETTPYNTYRIDGLPPTPIANPGREAIAAVLQPDTTDHLYFVADGTGGHAFARTLDEHNANVRRWREIERAAREAQENEAPAPAAVEPEQEPAEEARADEAGASGAEVVEAAKAAEPADAPEDSGAAAESAAAEGEAADGLLAATTADVPNGSPTSEPQAPTQAADPQPRVRESGTTVTLTDPTVPVPKPKPARD